MLRKVLGRTLQVRKTFTDLCLSRSIHFYEKPCRSTQNVVFFCRKQLPVVSEQSWQASRAESAELVAAVRRGVFVPHEGLQVRTTVLCNLF